VHWHTAVVAPDPGAAAARLRGARAAFVSPGLVSLPDGAPGIGAGFLTRDPDGHALRVSGRDSSR
jgi:hypothetical protein